MQDIHTDDYLRGHRLVRSERGDPETCEACGGPAMDWASIKGDYLDVWDYQAMCRSCHISMDTRRAHDEREDHKWAPAPYHESTCHECRKRYLREWNKTEKRRKYHREYMREWNKKRKAAQK